ncbi:MAG TPA: cupredoxin domain-containing protein [Candidatus Saccharimonadales bacterium]|nr:cupredoxin domain-containing protein [Candidatus Saccharimonadales bacterium]
MEQFNESSNEPFVSGGTGSYGKGSRGKKLWVIAVTLVVIVAAGVTGAVLLLGGKTANQPAVAISSNVAAVTIEKSGFMPKTIKVKQGQEITWTNNDSLPHHLTADQSMLPNFDTAEPLQTGDTYTYIFDTPGTYHYYDAADPNTFVGTITVE